MKDTVLAFLRKLPTKREELFNQSFALLRKTPSANQALISSYNMLGATDSNINNILYDLKKYNGITEVMIRATPTKVVAVPTPTGDTSPAPGTTPSEDDVKRTSLREQFPFLDDKDCPAELHIITGLLISSYNRYSSTMLKIQQFKNKEIELTPDEDLELTATAQSESVNNQALYKELEYYKENKQLLAEHISLKEYKWKKQFESMSAESKFKYKRNAESYFSKGKQELENPNVKEDRKAKIIENFKEREFIIALIDKELNAKQ
ncbi:hypothetical protein [Myroides odoratimimus]|uniref:Uncharacterized protein n=1 Tax=Myroides odoratimimus CIP 101113 TaxID=883154 RepID=A0AAV3F4Y2_9FLAO|nr:hypothetical protein [Myroides odoratimimus]EHO13821.1 hypothetical protein HMPREF9715_00895 [Myroides odoratimimus CIP 101113]